MNKKLILILILLIALVAGTMIFLSRQPPKTLSPLSNAPTTSHQPPITNKEYLDPSGFKFSYPKNLKLDAKNVSSSETLYADIKITAPDKKGSITIKAEDTTKTFFDETIKDKAAIKTTLDDIEAHQYQEKNQLITAAYDQGVQFVITADQSFDKKYWFGVNKIILNSFKFVEPSQPAANHQPPATDDDVIFEGEEEIE